ncbi:hypothetical protein BKA66DRAFT_472074 [Pyrenochaeta sp. MPI-SDFR-AT-0127]|nr:hypothetical protein BKA66DRAFT_472074 [Pyrenochaeta sp. MPI-SDFR-AT-0127]
MGGKPASRQEKNTEHASRVRDNKRRHRARQKEYVSDLERRLAKTREQGVQVTKEVQLAAQRVTRENAKLRDLLRRTGYTDDVIDAWVREDCLSSTGRPQTAFNSPFLKGVQKVTPACGSQRERDLEAQNASIKGAKPVLKKTCESGECLTKPSPPPGSRNEKSEVSSAQPSPAVCTKAPSPVQFSDRVEAPCKLVTLLTKNPAADITQVQLSAESNNQRHNISNPEDCNSDGIECYTAYKMLLQYATSEKSMDRIATALESGCTPSAAGGCKVKQSVVWAALDEECT